MAENITSTEWAARNHITSIERRIVNGECWALVKDETGMFGSCMVPWEEDDRFGFVGDDEISEDDIGDRDEFWFKTEKQARRDYERTIRCVAGISLKAPTPGTLAMCAAAGCWRVAGHREPHIRVGDVVKVARHEAYTCFGQCGVVIAEMGIQTRVWLESGEAVLGTDDLDVVEHERNGPPNDECIGECEACRQLRIADNASVQVAPRPKPTPCPNCDAWIEYGSSGAGDRKVAGVGPAGVGGISPDEPAAIKEHCPHRLAGHDMSRHMPCDTGDFSRDGDK